MLLAHAIALGVPAPDAPAALAGPEPDTARPAVLASHASSWTLDPRALYEEPGQFTGCPEGQRNAAESECLAAVQEATRELGEPLQGPVVKVVDAGPDGWVPSGCSYSRGHGQRAMFNRNPAGRSSGSYPLVCIEDGSQPPAADEQLAGIPPGEHIVMLGDSTMRYQYLNLAFLLKEGRKPAGEEQRLEYEVGWRCPGDDCSNLKGGDDAFKAFFSGTMALVGDECDCWRDTHTFPNVIENRYYSHPAGVHLSSIQLLGRRNLTGDWLPGDDEGLRGLQSEYAPRWSFGIVDSLERVVSLLKPTVVVINMGLHLTADRPTLDEDEWTALAGWAARSPSVRLVWKTTNCKAGGPAPLANAPEGDVRPPMSFARSEAEAALAAAHGLEVFNAHHVTVKLEEHNWMPMTSWRYKHLDRFREFSTQTNPHLASGGNDLLNAAMLSQLYSK